MCLTFFFIISVHEFFGLPGSLTPSTSYSIHFITQSLSSFRSTCPYHCNLFCCSTEISSNPSLSLLFLYLELHLLGTHPSNHSHLCLLKCHLIYFLTGQVSLPCNIQLCTQLLYNLPPAINDKGLLVSNSTKCLNLFHQIRILVSTDASASPLQ